MNQRLAALLITSSRPHPNHDIRPRAWKTQTAMENKVSHSRLHEFTTPQAHTFMFSLSDENINPPHPKIELLQLSLLFVPCVLKYTLRRKGLAVSLRSLRASHPIALCGCLDTKPELTPAILTFSQEVQNAT